MLFGIVKAPIRSERVKSENACICLFAAGTGIGISKIKLSAAFWNLLKRSLHQIPERFYAADEAPLVGGMG